MKAVVGTTVIAEADRDDLVSIEGNWYFPPSALRGEHFTKSPTPYRCPWKGDCQYFTVEADGQTLPDAAWSYPEPYDSAIQRVGRDFAGYVAFSKEVQVIDE